MIVHFDGHSFTEEFSGNADDYYGVWACPASAYFVLRPDEILYRPN